MRIDWLLGNDRISKRVETDRLVNASKIVIAYLQIMAASSTSYNIKWPAFMQAMLNQFQLALMDVYQTTAIDCLQEMNFYTTFWFAFVMFFFIVPRIFKSFYCVMSLRIFE
jgi:hypothetical protein